MAAASGKAFRRCAVRAIRTKSSAFSTSRPPPWNERRRATPRRESIPRAGRRSGISRKSAGYIERGRAVARRESLALDGGPAMTFRVVILGGYGYFGARIARTLAQDDDMEIIVA